MIGRSFCRVVMVFTAALFTTAATPSRAEELLRWKLNAGETLHVELAQKSELETNVANKPVKMKLDMGFGLKWQVESVSETGVARIAQSFTRLRLKMELPKQDPVEYDSAAETKPTGPAKDVADAVGPLIGAKFFVSMNDRGEIVDVKLSDEAAKLLETPAAARWKETISKEGLTDLLRQSAAVLPEKPVAKGASWTVPTSSKSPLGPLKLSHKYTYQGAEERGGKMLAKIAVQTTLELEASKGKPQLKEQKHSGLLYFDAEAGRFVETEVNQELATEAPYRDTVVKAKAVSTLRMKVSSQ
jgi:hypothetical protein